MEFKPGSDIYIEDIGVNGFEYKHKSGLSLILIKDSAYTDTLDINVTFKTPALDNSGIAHVIEHCIASEIHSTSFIKQYARTFQNRTSYEFVIKNNDIKIVRYVLNKIFFPKYKSDKNIFLREGWRIEYKNNKYNIKGIVYNEIREAFTSPLYCIINYIPYTLYGENIYGNVSGGTLENILDLNFEDTIKYHDAYYVPGNCCIYVYGCNCIFDIMDIVSSVLKRCTFNHPEVSNEYKTKLINSFKMSYPSIIKSDNDFFVSRNYPVFKPQNRFEYNVYNNLSALIANDYDGILTKKVERNKLGGIVKAAFKNSLYFPYITIILAYCEKKVHGRFLEECNQALQQAIESLNVSEMPDLVMADIHKKGNIDGLKLGKYVMEAFCADFDPFSFIKRYDEASAKNNYEYFANKLILKLSNYSTIELFSEIQTSNLEETLIKKAIKNGTVNEYKYIDNTDELFNKTNKNNVRKKINDFLNQDIVLPEIDKIDDIQYYLYKTNDSNVHIHFYFDISSLGSEEICCANILSRYINYYFFMKNNKSIICSCKAIDDSNFRFIIKISSDEINIVQQFDEIRTLLGNITSKSFDTDSMYSMLGKNKIAYKLDLINNKEHYLLSRISSYLSRKGFFEDALYGIDNFKFMWNNSFDNIIFKVKNVSESIINKKDTFVSVYAGNIPDIIKLLNKLFDGLSIFNRKICSQGYSAIQNEGFILPSELNYISQGYGLEQLGFKNSEKYKLLCNIITRNYLVPILREKHNVYSCKLIKTGKNIIFNSIKDPNISSTLKVFGKTDRYILNNRLNIMNEYFFLKRNLLLNYDEKEPNSRNDKITLGILSPDYYKPKNIVISELNDLTEDGIVEFSNLITRIIEKKCYCIIGNEKKIKEASHIFSSIENLL